MINQELLDAPEHRIIALADMEFRRRGDALSLDGYASVFDSPYPVNSRGRSWTETVDQRAFDTTLAAKPDVHLLINHQGLPLARTKSGTLHLAVDGKGLRVSAPSLDRRDPDVQRLEVKMGRRDLDEMSFAFRTKQDQWSTDESQRRLLEVSLHKGDVSVVNFGANPGTSSQMNSLNDALEFVARMDDELALAEMRGIDGADGLLSAVRSKLARMGSAFRPARNGRLSVADALLVTGGLTELDARAPLTAAAVNEDRKSVV